MLMSCEGAYYTGFTFSKLITFGMSSFMFRYADISCLVMLSYRAGASIFPEEYSDESCGFIGNKYIAEALSGISSWNVSINPACCVVSETVKASGIR